MDSAIKAFEQNRKLTIDVHRSNVAFQFPGDDKWYDVLHVDSIEKTYGLSNGKTRGAMSSNKMGLNYREDTTTANTYTITVVSLNDYYKKMINKVAKFNLNMGLMVTDKYTGKGFTFHYCSVNNYVGQTSIANGREALLSQIVLSTFEEEDSNDEAVPDTLETEDNELPTDAFPNI